MKVFSHVSAKKKTKGVRVSHFPVVLVAFKWHHGSEGVKQNTALQLSPGACAWWAPSEPSSCWRPRWWSSSSFSSTSSSWQGPWPSTPSLTWAQQSWTRTPTPPCTWRSSASSTWRTGWPSTSSTTTSSPSPSLSSPSSLSSSPLPSPSFSWGEPSPGSRPLPTSPPRTPWSWSWRRCCWWYVTSTSSASARLFSARFCCSLWKGGSRRDPTRTPSSPTSLSCTCWAPSTRQPTSSSTMRVGRNFAPLWESWNAGDEASPFPVPLSRTPRRWRRKGRGPCRRISRRTAPRGQCEAFDTLRIKSDTVLKWWRWSYLWWSYVRPSVYTHARWITVGESGLCCCICVTYFERWLTPLRVESDAVLFTVDRYEEWMI